MLLLVLEDLPSRAPPTHAKHAARNREEDAHAPAVQKPEVERQVPAKEKNAVPVSTKTSTLTAVMAVAAAAAAVEVAAAEVAVAVEVAAETAVEVVAAGTAAEAATPVSIAAEKHHNALAQSSSDARTISSSVQMLVAAAVD